MIQALKHNGNVVLSNCQVAVSFTSRFLGLMGRRRLNASEGILFPNCNSIHTFFMRFPIDVVLLEKTGIVIGIIGHMKPWRLLWPKKKVNHILEMESGKAEKLGLQVGMSLQLEGVF